MKNRIIIFGSSGFGREVLSFIISEEEYEFIGFIDNNLKQGTVVDGCSVLGSDNEIDKIIKDFNINSAFIAIGNRKVREKIYLMLKKYEIKMVNIIHKSSEISSNCLIGEGVIIYPNVTINTSVKIGNSVLINSNVSIGHDCRIESFVNINPGVNIAGNVTINQGAFIGIGASILENILIGKNSTVGGSALVNKAVSKDITVIGIPAREVQ